VGIKKLANIAYMRIKIERIALDFSSHTIRTESRMLKEIYDKANLKVLD